jgi:hypothetical protein
LRGGGLVGAALPAGGRGKGESKKESFRHARPIADRPMKRC